MVSAGRISLICVAFAPFAAPAVSGVTGLAKVTSPGAANATRGKYANCKALNRKYPHGVGRVGARDKTSDAPVTTFTRSNTLYRLTRHLDRDGDKIACEKR
jgi:hypothetical protein